MDFDRFEVLTFDCYGTLIDWEAGILGALRPVLERHGITLADRELLERYARLEAEIEAGPFQRYARVQRAVVEGLGRSLGFSPNADEAACLARSLGDWPPFPDTVAALRNLGRRYRLGILSNVDRDLFAGSAERLEVRFDFVVTAEEVGAYKPSPLNFRQMLAQAGADPERVLHAAQSLYHDIAPAKELGLATVWVSRRSGSCHNIVHPAFLVGNPRLH